MRSKHKTLLLEELILRDESTCRLNTPFELVFQTLLPYVMLRRTITIPLRWNRERCPDCMQTRVHPTSTCYTSFLDYDHYTIQV